MCTAEWCGKAAKGARGQELGEVGAHRMALHAREPADHPCTRVRRNLDEFTRAGIHAWIGGTTFAKVGIGGLGIVGRI